MHWFSRFGPCHLFRSYNDVTNIHIYQKIWNLKGVLIKQAGFWIKYIFWKWKLANVLNFNRIWWLRLNRQKRITMSLANQKVDDNSKCILVQSKNHWVLQNYSFYLSFILMLYSYLNCKLCHSCQDLERSKSKKLWKSYQMQISLIWLRSN